MDHSQNAWEGGSWISKTDGYNTSDDPEVTKLKKRISELEKKVDTDNVILKKERNKP